MTFNPDDRKAQILFVVCWCGLMLGLSRFYQKAHEKRRDSERSR